MFKFSKTSRERLDTCDGALIQVMEDALRASDVDFGISEGHRSIERQQRLYNEGKSKIDGITRKGKHNENPSKAVDIYAWVNGANYDKENLCYIAGVVHAVAANHGLNVRWGGNWDRDNIIITDQSFDDLVHFELK